MTNKIIHKNMTETPIYSVMDLNGKITDPDFKVSLSNDELIKAYYFMRLSRKLDQKMLQMQRQGRMLTFPPNLGEEGLQVAVALAMDKKDYLVPAFRSGAMFLTLGVPIHQMMLLWNGNERGNKIPEGINIIPTNIPIATQYSHAAGIGLAFEYSNINNVAVSFIGDGGTAEGEFYEAMNFAAIHKAKTVFCINTNQWSISTPIHLESKNTDLAVKAVAAGMAYIRVDGNDFFASHEAFKLAREYALTEGPILVEFITYRQGPHTTSDNPKIYRTAEQEAEGNKTDPIPRLEKWFFDNNVLNEAKIKEIEDQIDGQIASAIKEQESVLNVSVDEVFDYTFESLYDDLEDQKQQCKKLFGEK